MSASSSAQLAVPVLPDADALLVALILAPGTYSRNKYFTLFQNQVAHRVRRRAQIVRSILKELTEPWPEMRHAPGGPRSAPPATLLDERTTSDGVELVYRVDEFGYTRSALLTHLEAAALRYALSRVGQRPVAATDKQLVESALSRLDPTAP